MRSLGDTLLVLLLRTLLGSEAPPAGLLRLMSDERLMPAVFAVLETPEQPWTLEVWPPALFCRAPPSPGILPARITLRRRPGFHSCGWQWLRVCCAWSGRPTLM